MIVFTKVPKCKKIGIAFETQVICEWENDLFDINGSTDFRKEGIENEQFRTIM